MDECLMALNILGLRIDVFWETKRATARLHASLRFRVDWMLRPGSRHVSDTRALGVDRLEALVPPLRLFVLEMSDLGVSDD
jgi:hypothetical protein